MPFYRNRHAVLAEFAAVNNHFEPDEIRIPFRNKIYIGDSDTDIPCMKLVTSNGGHAIGVYDCDSKDKTMVQKMIHDNRISYYAEADYRKGKALERIVKAIIDQTSSNEAIESIKTKCIKETVDAYDGKHLIFDSSDITGILYNDLLIVFSDYDSSRNKEIRIDYAVCQSLSKRLVNRCISNPRYPFQFKRYFQIL